MLEPPAQNPLALMYGSYIRELLQAFAKCNHAYQRETDYEDSKILRLSQVGVSLSHFIFCYQVLTRISTECLEQPELIMHVPPLLKQLNKLLECDLQASPLQFFCFVVSAVNQSRRTKLSYFLSNTVDSARAV